MANEKEMGRSNLEQALRRQFPDDEIDQLLKKIDEAKDNEKLSAEENPFFYGRVLQVISSSQSTNIAEWLDDKAVGRFADIAKVCKEEKAQEKAEQEEKRKKEEELRNVENTEERDVEKLKEILDGIDYKNLDAESLFTALENFDLLYTEQSAEEVADVLGAAQEVFGTDEVLSQIMIINKRAEDYEKEFGKPYQYTAEELEFLDSIKDDESYSKYIKKTPNDSLSLNKEEVKETTKDFSRVGHFIKTRIYSGQPLDIDAIVSDLMKVQENSDENKLRQAVESFVSNNALSNLQDLSREEACKKIDGILENSRKRYQEIKLPNSGETQKLAAENDQVMQNLYRSAVEYYIPKEVRTANEAAKGENLEGNENSRVTVEESLDDELMAALGNFDLEEEAKQFDSSSELADDKSEHEETAQVEKTQEEIQSEENPKGEETIEETINETIDEMQQIQENEYIEDIQEEDTKVGLAGIFGNIKDRVTNFFNRINQKALPDPQNQKETGGSLIPMNIRFRNALTQFSINTIGKGMEKLSQLVGINNQETAKNTLKAEIITKEQSKVLNNDRQNMENEQVNEFDARYSIYSKTSDFYMTPEQREEARQTAFSGRDNQEDLEQADDEREADDDSLSI